MLTHFNFSVQKIYCRQLMGQSNKMLIFKQVHVIIKTQGLQEGTLYLVHETPNPNTDLTQQNLSHGFLTKLDSNHSLQLQRLARN